MGSVQMNHDGDCIEDTCMEQLLSPDTSDAYNVFGDPELFPRVGDQYQVGIPPLVTRSEYDLNEKNPFEVELVRGVHCDFLVGLPIPIMWINKEVEKPKHERLGNSNGPSKNNGLLISESKAQIFSKDEDTKVKVECVDMASEDRIGLGESGNLALKQETESEMHLKQKDDGNYLVPGSSNGSWSDTVEASFLLALCIFGKNLVLVKKFVEGKTMGDIQSFYYGKFYRSDEYKKWSECRKKRSKKGVHGQRIFTGWRQQELLTRLSRHVSEECQNTLLEVSKTFGEGKMSLEEYVFTLKALVGMNSLVEAVGIGTGKQDLTGITMEASKSNHVVPVRPDIPIGKACSSLTAKEIIKFLTGDFRLSKARSNDLFWEAVWPRLLARGWHSEQPKDQSYAAGSKNSLVFLIPGVKKFSRRRLVNGINYFNSITDVLNKVASNPSLLELENEADEENRNKEESGCTVETKLAQNDISDQPDRQRRCYLQPRTPSRSSSLMKFTVVDTSLADGIPFKVRELRTLPDEVSTKTTISGSHSAESMEDNSELSSEDSESDDTVLFDQEDTKNSSSAKDVFTVSIPLCEKNVEKGASNQQINGPDSGNASFKISKGINNFCKDKQPTKSLKRCRGSKQDGLDNIAPVTKRHHRLSACTQTETSHHTHSFLGGHNLEQDKHVCCSDTADSNENNLSGTASSQKQVSFASWSKESPIESSEGVSGDNNPCVEGPPDKTQPRTLIDLNLPQLSPDSEFGDASTTGLRDRQDDQTIKPENNTAPMPSAAISSSEPQPNVTSRRQSTRNRPPTARALEALANGFLTVSRKRKSKETYKRDNPISRPPQPAHGGTEFAENLASGTVAPQMLEGGNGLCNTDSEVFRKFPFLPEGDAAQVTGP